MNGPITVAAVQLLTGFGEEVDGTELIRGVIRLTVSILLLLLNDLGPLVTGKYGGRGGIGDGSLLWSAIYSKQNTNSIIQLNQGDL